MDLTPAQIEVANSLAQDDIPFKLRCAMCNKLAINAFRLPCCDQSICENCHQTLPENCPVCDHSPLSSDLCKPNKALRTTVRAFLRTAEIKQEKAQPVVKESTPMKSELPVVEAPSAKNEQEQVRATEEGVGEPGNHVKVEGEGEGAEVVVKQELPGDGDTKGFDSVEGLEQAQQSESSVPRQTEASQPPETSAVEQSEQGTDAKPADQNEGEIGGRGPTPQQGGGFPGQMPNTPNGMGFNMNSGFPGMGWNGQPDYSQMMPFMGGAMGTNPMGNLPNMMGMPGFGMDSMAAQSMYAGFGGMGVNNGVNMGMGFNARQGMYGGAWNGQNNMWNGAQDKYNPNAFANSMGNFGPNSGYGYNMSQNPGNFSQMPHQQQQFPNNDFQQGYQGQYGRGRGRGRGYGYGNRGRGYGQQQHMQANQGNYNANPNHIPQQQWQQQPGGHSEQRFQNEASPATSVKQAADENSVGGEPVQSIEEQATKSHDEAPAENDSADAPTSQQGDPPTPEDAIKEEETINTADTPKPAEDDIQPVRSILDEEPSQIEAPPFQMAPDTLDENLVQSPTNVMAPPTAPLGPAAQFNADTYDMNGRGRGNVRGSYRAGFRGRGGSLSNGSAFTSPPRASEFPGIKAVEPVGQGVVGAPTGPKAMREGFPNTGMRGGISINIRGSAASSIPSGPRNGEHERSVSPDRYRDRDESRSRSRSRSQSPSRHRSHRHRHRRHRSTSVSDTELEREKKRERKHKRSRRDNADDEQAIQDDPQQYSRASTPASSKISSHRSQQEKERRSSHKHRSSHRHRHRSRSREHRHGDKTPLTPLENGTEKIAEYANEEKPQERSSNHRSEKDRSRRHRDEKREEEKPRDRKRSRRDRSPSAENPDYSSHNEPRRQKRDPEPDIPKGPRTKTVDRPAEPQKDPHTLEREARNRERMLKEQQRREAMNTGPERGLKRRESRQSNGGSRRMSYNYEDEESNSARAARIEQERESARWG